VILAGGEAIVGDMIMGGMVFFPRQPRIPYFATDMDQVRQSVRRVLALNPHTIYAAHGGPFTPDAVRKKFG
jgi:glyoxylase-like metal-dependent hydrolase (beta-lactamase superfamily II)